MDTNTVHFNILFGADQQVLHATDHTGFDQICLFRGNLNRDVRHADLKSFKVFLLDVGLLRAMSKISPKVILEGSRIFEEFKGALTEQYVCQELQNFAETLETNYYWSSSATAEVDFLISDGLDVYPLEAKAGVTMNAKSLKLYREKYSPKWSVRTSLLPYERNNSSKTINIPLYMLFVLDKELKAGS